MIGWTIDLDSNIISICKKNFLKTLYSFFIVDTERKVQVKVIEKLAAYSARYTLVFRIMRPFTTVLYGEITGLRDREVHKFLSNYSKVAVWMWRVVLCQLRFKESTFARSLHSFVHTQPDVSIEYDAAVGDGIGISLRNLRVTGDNLIGIGRVSFPYNLGNNPMYQNLAEFTAVVIGCVCLVRKGFTHIAIQLHGDNKTSLKWGSSERFKGILSRCAALVYVLIGIKYNLVVCSSVHIAGVDNILHDKLSRGVTPTELGYDATKILNLQSDIAIHRFLELCDPNRIIENYDQFLLFWSDVRQAIVALQH
jgi:hypothetical protein